MTPQEFFNYTYGHAYDIDGSYGYQCWDGMAKFCQDLKIPLSTIHCGITGYVQDIWELRKKSGILTFFDEIAPENIQTGDWIIWPRSYSMTPKSHVAMAYKGYAYGQSQNGQRDIEARTQEVGSEVISQMKDLAMNNLGEIRDVQATIQQGFAEQQRCCCETLRAIDGVNYNASLNTASINATTVAQTQKILDAITANRMNDMQNQINALQLQNAVAGVVRYPTQTSYCSGANPFGCGCNNL